MLNQVDILVHLEHHKDLLREAEQARLAHLAISSQPETSSSFTPFAFLARLAKFAFSSQPDNRMEQKTMAHKNTRYTPVKVICCNPAEAACCVSEGC